MGALGHVANEARHRIERARSVADKLSWGIRIVGIATTARGVARLVCLRVTKPKSAVVHLRSGPVLSYDYPSQAVPALIVFGALIDPEYEFLRIVAQPTWLVVDVGAAIGQFSVFAAGLPAMRVHAYEPSRANTRSLTRNLALNSVSDRVVVHETALAASVGEMHFATARNAYMSGLDEQAPIGTDTLVAVSTLDDECRRLGIDHIDVLKVNVAGHEPDVLAGGRKLLRTGSAAVLILLIGRQSLQSYRELVGYGYRFFFYHPVERRMYEVERFDEAFLVTRPWPARHVIAVHHTAIEQGILADISLRRPPS